jgi:hypothetical protein
MGKQIGLIIVLVFMVSFVYAQDVVDIQAGINFANLSDPGNLIQGAKWLTTYGIVGSVSTRFEIGSNISLAPGLRFIQCGTKAEWSTMILGNINSSVTNNYLELPVYLSYMLIDNIAKIFLIGGPTVSYLVSSRTEGTTQFMGSVSYDSKKDYKTTNASIDLGLSSMFPLNEKIFLVASTIYSYGLMKISAQGSNERTRDFMILVGISYSFK